MRILITVDPEIPVPPGSYGGIERIADGLAKGYKEAGHEVFLIANKDSTCTHTVRNFGWPAGHSQGLKNIWRNMWYLTSTVKNIAPDVVHSFSRLLYGYPLFLQRRTSFIQSYQREISPTSTKAAHLIAGNRLMFTACAAHMLKGLSKRRNFSSIFNFTDVHYFKPAPVNKGTHLFFLGRIEEIKGPREAIELAIATDKPIIVAGNIQPGHESYFHDEIEPLLQHPLVEYVGSVNDAEKKKYLQNAMALIFPIKWEEPFGIVMAEALACGVPVIALRRGSVPEVIKDGINGFACETLKEMVVAVDRLGELQPHMIRADAVNRFSLEQVTRQYLKMMRIMCDKKRKNVIASA